MRILKRLGRLNENYMRSKLNIFLPKNVFIFGFDRNKDIYQSYVNAEYTVVHAILEGPGYSDYSSEWQDYISNFKDGLNVHATYIDDDGNVYCLLVDAISRESLLPDGNLPIACKDSGHVYYVTDDEFLVLPECFKA